MVAGAAALGFHFFFFETEALLCHPFFSGDATPSASAARSVAATCGGGSGHAAAQFRVCQRDGMRKASISCDSRDAALTDPTLVWGESPDRA